MSAHLIHIAACNIGSDSQFITQLLRFSSLVGVDTTDAEQAVHELLVVLIVILLQDFVIDGSVGPCRHVIATLGGVGQQLVIVNLIHHFGFPALTQSSAMACSVTGRPRRCNEEIIETRWPLEIVAMRISSDPTTT